MLFLKPYGHDDKPRPDLAESCLRLVPLGLWAFYLLLLPLFPSQDGSTHLLTGQMFFDTLLGRQPEPAFYELNTTLFTNLSAAFCLGFLQEIGLSELWAERLWLFVIGALLFAAFQVVSRRNRQPAIVGFLLLLLLESRIMHMGFWNFLLGVALGFLGYSCRRQGRMSPAGDLLFVLALASHPMGGQFFLGLVFVEAALARAPRRLLRIVPHIVACWIVTQSKVVGDVVWQGLDFPDVFFSGLGAVGGTSLLDLASRIAIVALLLLWLVKSMRTKGREEQDRSVLWAGALLLLASAFVPLSVGNASDIPERLVFLAAFCLFPALPLREIPRFSRLATVLLPVLIVVQLWPSLSYAHEVAVQQERELSLLPGAEEDRSYILGCDSFDVGFFPLNFASPRSKIESSAFSLARIKEQARFNPWMHFLDRWAVRGRAIHVLSHQALYEHCLLRLKQEALGPLTQVLQYYPRFLPFDALAAQAEACLLIHLPEGWQQSLLPRLTSGWEVERAGERFVLLRSRILRDGPVADLRVLPVAKPENLLRPYLVPASGTDIVIDTQPQLAHFGWRAFVLYADQSYARADRKIVDPVEGYLDAQGRASLKRVKAPKGAQLILVPK